MPSADSRGCDSVWPRLQVGDVERCPEAQLKERRERTFLTTQSAQAAQTPAVEPSQELTSSIPGRRGGRRSRCSVSVTRDQRM